VGALFALTKPRIGLLSVATVPVGLALAPSGVALCFGVAGAGGDVSCDYMELVPQIRYWPKTGRVAANKIINLNIPELVRGLAKRRKVLLVG
jgi:hypothetical protein